MVKVYTNSDPYRGVLVGASPHTHTQKKNLKEDVILKI